MNWKISLFTAFIRGLVCFGVSPKATAEEFYKGKTIRVIVGFAAGGGYDTYARAVTRHMGRHIPRNPSFVVENMDEAGSLLAANHLFANRLLAATIFRLGSSLTALAQKTLSRNLSNILSPIASTKIMGKGGEFRMEKSFVLLSGITLFALTLTFAGCGKKEEPALPPPAPAEPAPPVGGGETKAPADQPGGAPMEKKKEEGAKTK